MPYRGAALGLLAAVAVGGALLAVRPGLERGVLAESDVPQAEVPAPPVPSDLTPPGELVERDLDAIRERKTLVVLAPYNSTTYFLYRGEPMGYEYDLLKAFAREQNLALRLKVVRDEDQLLPMLRRGEGDVAAARLIPPAPDEAARQKVAFTRALYRTKPVLVQRNPGAKPKVPPAVREAIRDKAVENPESDPDLPKPSDLRPQPAPPGTHLQARLITRPSELPGHDVTLNRRSAYIRTLVEIEEETSGDIHVISVDGNVDAEQLIERVSRGEVDLTVAQANLAKLKETVFTSLAVTPILGPQHAISWAVRENSPALRAALDAWIERERGGRLFRGLYRKYFVNSRGYRRRVTSRYLTSRTGRLSPYDPLLRQHSAKIDWDWRMLASLAFQESRFDPAARSWAGAAGLLQLMPSTARGFGCGNRLRPEENVRAGVRFLAWLQAYWKNRIPDEKERLKFVLASYNAGPGHVDDACRLAQKHGDDPQVWDDVAYWMLQLSQRKFYEDPVVRYGFCRGVEPVTYVDVILERYDHYRQFVSARAREAIPVRTARMCPASEMASAEPVGRDWLAHRRKTRSSGDGWPEAPLSTRGEGPGVRPFVGPVPSFFRHIHTSG